MTAEDKKEIRQMMVEVVGGALEEIVLPRFDNLENDVAILKEDVGILKEDVGILKEDVGSLKSSMKSMEFRMDSLEVKVDRIDRRTSENEDAFADDILKLYDQDKWAKREILKLKAASS